MNEKEADLRRWLGIVAGLVSPGFTAQAAEGLVAFVPYLGDIPQWAICKRSAEAVALGKRRQAVPALDELRAALQAWMREQPQPPQLMQHGALAAADTIWVEFFNQRMCEGPIGKVFARAANDQLSLHEAYERHLLSLVKQQSWPAWREIMNRRGGGLFEGASGP